MQARHAARAALRRLALQKFPTPPRNILPWNKPAARLIHYTNNPLRSPDQPAHTPTQAAQTKKKPHAPRPQLPNDQPAYEMTFTCKPCSTRSTHRISKQGYHYGSVLITCPECKNRHIISDHLKIFMDKATTIEDLMREKGQLVKKGTLSEDGDLEFWDNGTTTDRVKAEDSEAGVV